MNSVIHFELPVKSLERAQEFYARVFGWVTSNFDAANVLVSTTETNEKGVPTKVGAINGSFRKTEDVSSSITPNIVIEVADIAKQLEIVTRNGGVVVDEATEIPGIGMFARFRDTEGNLVGLWQNNALRTTAPATPPQI